jgi:hypothetical protein
MKSSATAMQHNIFTANNILFAFIVLTFCKVPPRRWKLTRTPHCGGLGERRDAEDLAWVRLPDRGAQTEEAGERQRGARRRREKSELRTHEGRAGRPW